MANKLWNTGVDDAGHQLAPGRQDQHWIAISGPKLKDPRPAYVIDDQRQGTYFQTADSMWIGVVREALAVPGSVPYVYRTTFDVDADSSHWIQISGIWGADNYAQLTMDGAPLPPGCATGEYFLLPGMILTNFNRQHAFSISEMHPISLSQLQLPSGEHTLEVWLYNEGTGGAQSNNPSAFNISAAAISLHKVSRPYIVFPR